MDYMAISICGLTQIWLYDETISSWNSMVCTVTRLYKSGGWLASSSLFQNIMTGSSPRNPLFNGH
jgi:hypothetical protein